MTAADMAIWATPSGWRWLWDTIHPRVQRRPQHPRPRAAIGFRNGATITLIKHGGEELILRQ